MHLKLFRLISAVTDVSQQWRGLTGCGTLASCGLDRWGALGSHQLVSFVLVEEQRLFQWSSDVGVGGDALEVGGCKLGKLVLRQILLLLLGQRRGFVQHLLFSLLAQRSFLQVLGGRLKTRGLMKIPV